MKSLSYAHPVLTCQQAREFEPTVLKDDAAAWAAMQRAGKGTAEAIIRDYRELFEVPDHLQIVALIGKGHNGGDALIACATLLANYPRATVTLLLAASVDDLKPLAKRAYDQIEGRVTKHIIDEASNAQTIGALLETLSVERSIDICIDGLLGMSFEPPLRGATRVLIEAVNQFERIRLRASVDLPSGRGDVSDEVAFNAEFTYATGIAKHALVDGLATCGRVRFIDLGFFDQAPGSELESVEHILHPRVLAPLQKFRSASVDKREFGHLLIVGGSAYMPGALLMAVQAAVRSGVGTVTAFAPASVASVLSAQVPEAMWVPWPETSNGTLSPRALPLLLDRLESATAVLCGPGMGRDRNTEMLGMEMVRQVNLPLILDADALRQRTLEAVDKRKPHWGSVVLTPHMGEFMRIAKLPQPDFSLDMLMKFCTSNKVTTVLKGANTRICDGKSMLYNTQGGPVLSRGGSGDLLAGLIGGMAAQDSVDTNTAVARGVMLHGLAAQRLARDKGQVAVNTTQLLDYLPEVLRNDLG
ncbi:MAG: NAD(P)H-hydrate dehydratase [Opitutaceae bacterium]